METLLSRLLFLLILNLSKYLQFFIAASFRFRTNVNFLARAQKRACQLGNKIWTVFGYLKNQFSRLHRCEVPEEKKTTRRVSNFLHHRFILLVRSRFFSLTLLSYATNISYSLFLGTSHALTPTLLGAALCATYSAVVHSKKDSHFIFERYNFC